MAESKSWRHNDKGQAEFRDPFSLLLTLFGVMMALCGGFFLVGMAVGLFRPGGWEAALARPGNTLGVFAFALSFFAIGWFAAFHRRRIVIDPAAREVSVMHDVFPFKWSKNHQVGDFRAVVMVNEKTMSTSTSASRSFHTVRMVKPDRECVLLASLYDAVDAAELGNKVAAMLGGELIEMSRSQWDKAF